MSLGLRGEEGKLVIAIDGQMQDTGTFADIEEWTVEHLSDFMEYDAAGEDATEYDTQHHGVSIKGRLRVKDDNTMRYIDDVIARQEGRQAPASVVATMFYSMRDAGGAVTAVTVHRAVMKLGARSVRRKEYIMEDFEIRGRKQATTDAG